MRMLVIAAVLLPLVTVAYGAVLSEDGLYKEDWFAQTSKNVREDLRTAELQGRRLALIIEQRGCIYCKRLHEEILSDPHVRDYISENFMIVQYNGRGDGMVTDLDGDVMTEHAATAKWGVVYTPTIIFLPEEVTGKISVDDAAVTKLIGGFDKSTTVHMFQWVREKGYSGDEPFQEYHARRLDEERSEGQLAR